MKTLIAVLGVVVVGCTPRVVLREDTGAQSTLKPLPVSVGVKANGERDALAIELGIQARKRFVALGHTLDEAGTVVEIEVGPTTSKMMNGDETRCIEMIGRVIRGARFVVQDSTSSKCLKTQLIDPRPTGTEFDLLLAPVTVAQMLASQGSGEAKGATKLYLEALDVLVRELSRKAQASSEP